jgi:glucose/arabinose dehydrogenase
MNTRIGPLLAVLTILSGLAACATAPAAPVETGFGPNPKLPPPEAQTIPTVNIAVPDPWPPSTMPTAAPGLAVTEFAAGLDHPRWVYQLPNGDVLVAESNKPPRGERSFSITNFVAKRIMGRAGAGSTSADRITLLRDADGDGVAETKTVFLSDLYSPFGMALVGDTLYIANADGVVTVPYHAGETAISATPKPFFALPGGPINHHWTKNIAVSPDGRSLYASVGSNSNIGDNGMAAEEGRAAIWKIDLATGKGRVFASGLRNPVGMAFDRDGTLYTVVNERDLLGDNLVPDYLTSVKDGAFYGWPYSYFGGHVDERVQPERPDLVAKAIAPDYALGSHTASLGLDISQGKAAGISASYGHGAFIGQHGSWNRRPHSGYEVIFVPFDASGPKGEPRKVLTGFLVDEKARGRPVGVLLDQRGGLLVADDVGNRIWRVAPK